MISEKELEENLLKQLSDQGYEIVDVKDEESLLENFRKQLEKFNNIKFSNEEFTKILTHLAGGSIFEKSKKLRDKFELLKENGKIEYIKFIDKENVENNIFQITNQITIKGLYENRYDVTILVNGLPLVQIELKKKTVQLKKAFYQVQRYQRHSYSYKALFQYIQIFVISNEENTRYFSNNNELNYAFTFSWADEYNLKKNKLTDFTASFLDRKHLGNMLTKYIVTNETMKALMILRPYQYYAVEKIIDRVKNYPNRNGYIWHTTGSGKTLTSFKASQILSSINGIDKVIFCVDRKDLDYQTSKEFNAFSKGSVGDVNNTGQFVDQMISSNYNILVSFYEKYIQSCTVQRFIFPQMAFRFGELDAIDSTFVEEGGIYISHYSRLIDAIRLGDIIDEYGNEINITPAQEYYLRFTLATWIMTKLNSYNSLCKQIKTAMSNGYEQLIFIVELKVVSPGKWLAAGRAFLYTYGYQPTSYDFSDTLFIDEDEFYSSNPFGVHSNFYNTPMPLLESFYQLTYMLLGTTPHLIEFNRTPRRAQLYANFWLKKMVATIIMASEEWKTLIQSHTNVEAIDNIRYYLWNEKTLEKQIQFKFDIKLRKQNRWISLSYEYTIVDIEAFGISRNNELSQFVLENHNLED